MTKHSGGPAINQGGASKPGQEERDREFPGRAGKAEASGERPSRGGRDRGETSSADEPAPVDLDTAHDRAS